MDKVFFLQLEGEQTLTQRSVTQFEQLFGIRYAAHLEFPAARDRYLVAEQCRLMDEGEQILDEQRWLGVFYKDALRRGDCAPVEIRFIDAEIGYGLFAQDALLGGALVGEFTGEVLRKRFWDFQPHDYRFRYPTYRFFWRRYVIDAEQAGNELRFANHSDEPNLEACSAFLDGLFHILLRTTRPVRAGEQLCFDYGPEYWRRRGQPRPLPGPAGDVA